MKKNFFIIAVIGPDGSGKTLLINYLRKSFNKINLKNERIHLKPTIFKSKIRKVSNPHSKPARSNLMTIIKLLFWLLSYYLFYIINFIENKKVVFFFDRYVHDIIADPLRYRINLDEKILFYLLNLFPKPDFWCFTTGDAKKIWSRKKEVKFDILKVKLNRYRKLKKQFRNSLSISKKKQFPTVFRILLKKYKFINK
jgi:thymidylate kinase